MEKYKRATKRLLSLFISAAYSCGVNATGKGTFVLDRQFQEFKISGFLISAKASNDLLRCMLISAKASNDLLRCMLISAKASNDLQSRARFQDLKILRIYLKR